MSRIGKLPIKIPSGVNIDIKGKAITVKGPKGELFLEIDDSVQLSIEDANLIVQRSSDSKDHRSKHGLYRSLLANMVQGVSDGFEKTLEIIGVGYRASKKGEDLEVLVGYSNPVMVRKVEGISFDVPTNTTIVIKGIDKQLVGQVAANIREIRKPEPYKGKGIRYQAEYVRRKVGKAGASAAK